jgi:hypothetical protein
MQVAVPIRAKVQDHEDRALTHDQSWRSASLIRRPVSCPLSLLAVRGPAYGWLHAATAPDHRPGTGASARQARLGGRRPEGSHAQLKHPSRGGRVTVPLHAGETIGPGLLRSILSQAGVTVEELRAVL